MSVPVPLRGLRAAVDERGASGYLLTVCDDGAPHAVHAPLRWDGDVILVAGHGAGDERVRPRRLPRSGHGAVPSAPAGGVAALPGAG